MENTKNNEPVVLNVDDLKEVLGGTLQVSVIATTQITSKIGQLMIPSNQPCPTEPHNHDGAGALQGFGAVVNPAVRP